MVGYSQWKNGRFTSMRSSNLEQFRKREEERKAAEACLRALLPSLKITHPALKLL